MAKASGIVVRPSIFRDKVTDSKDGENTGRTTGLKLTHFVSELLVANRKAKLTDDALMAAMKAEFPKREKAGGVIQKIASYRGYFNQGLHGHNPEKQFGRSESYNADGEARQRAASNGKPAAKKKAAKKPTGKGGKKGKAAAKGGGKGKPAAAAAE